MYISRKTDLRGAFYDNDRAKRVAGLYDWALIGTFSAPGSCRISSCSHEGDVALKQSIMW